MKRDTKLAKLPMQELRALIERQFAGKRKAEADIKEYDELLSRSLTEFMRRVDEMARVDAPTGGA